MKSFTTEVEDLDYQPDGINALRDSVIKRFSDQEAREIDHRLIYACLQVNGIVDTDIDKTLGEITDNRQKQQIEFRYDGSLLGTLPYDIIYGGIKQFHKVNIISGRV